MRLRRCAPVALLTISLLAPGTSRALDDHHTSFLGRPDGHAPIGVMGDHMHAAGEVMFSYRFGRMRMKDSRDGDNHKTDGEVLRQGFLATPTDMDMEMHMFGLMYAPTDFVTLSAMLPYVRNQMDHINAMSLKFHTNSDGIGDFRLGSLWRLYDDETHHLHFNLSLSFPTGRTRHKDDVPSPGGPVNTTLPFPMQIGSGTWDTQPGFTYVGNTSWLSWGGQALGTIRGSKSTNDAGWRKGHRADVTSWVAVPWSDLVSTSARVSYQYFGNYGGNENRPPPPSAIPTADPNRRAGHIVSLHPGINFYVPLGPLRKHRFAVEAGFPIYQWYDGPQLETRWQIVAGWQFAFKAWSPF